MRAALVLAVLSIATLSGCTRAPTPEERESPHMPDAPSPSVCEGMWPIVLGEEARVPTAVGARVELQPGPGAPRVPLSATAAVLRWGDSRGEDVSRQVWLDRIPGPPFPWTLRDVDHDGALGPGDVFSLAQPTGDPAELWLRVDLYDANATFLGGTARCL